MKLLKYQISEKKFYSFLNENYLNNFHSLMDGKENNIYPIYTSFYPYFVPFYEMIISLNVFLNKFKCEISFITFK